MRIEAVRVDELEVPFRTPFETAGRTWRSRRLALLRILVGVEEGLGEIALEGPGGLPVPIPPGLLELLVGVELDTAESVGRALTAIENGWTLGRAARAGAETAVMDLTSRLSGARLCDRLTNRPSGSVLLNGLVGAERPSTAARAADRLVRAGFGCLKIKADGDVVERASAVRAKVGPAVRIRVDANGSWPERLAIETMRDLRPLDLEYVEQPIPPSLGAAALARVRRTGGMPVAADEAVTDPEGAAELLLAGAVDALVVKPSRVGGPRQARRIVELASDLGIGVTISTLFETGVGLAAALHVAASVPDVGAAHGLATAGLLESDLLIEGPVVADGRLALPAGPGLGIRLDWDAVDAYRVR